MSNALAEVKFKDGTILYTQYQGSSDTFYSALFETSEEAWGFYRHDPKGWTALTRRAEMEEPEEVEVISHYGGGSSWTGTACKKTLQLKVNYPEGWLY